MLPTGNPPRVRPARKTARWKWAIALISIVVAVGVCEALLRFALFHTELQLAAKDPAYYARTLDELWVYRHLFSNAGQLSAAPDQAGGMRDSSIEFYRDWSASLQPDSLLGYARKPNVRVPCHETSGLGTRGRGGYDPGSPKLVFFGDSFVESAACSNDTLTTKLERLTGIDTLNYGVGGYGLDQILLSFERVAPRFDRADCLILIGLIQNDLERVLLQVRSAPKPYFTVDGDRLALHTDHIDAKALGDYFQRPPERFYLYDFLRGRLGHPAYAAFLRDTRVQRQAAVADLSTRIVERFADDARRSRFRMAFVIFPTPGAPFDETLMASMRAAGVAVIDLQSCLRASGRPDTELYAELHPTSLGNDLLAHCLVDQLAQSSQLR